MWLEIWSVFVIKGGDLVLNPKRCILEVKAEQFKVVLAGKAYTTQILLRQWTNHITELKGGLKMWAKK